MTSWTHRHRTRRHIPDQIVDSARALILEAREEHCVCCTCCLVCQTCGYPCLTARMAETLRQLTKDTGP